MDTNVLWEFIIPAIIWAMLFFLAGKTIVFVIEMVRDFIVGFREGFNGGKPVDNEKNGLNNKER